MISIKIGIFAKFFYEKSHPGKFDPLNGLVLVDTVDFTSRDWKSDVLVVMVVCRQRFLAIPGPGH